MSFCCTGDEVDTKEVSQLSCDDDDDDPENRYLKKTYQCETGTGYTLANTKTSAVPGKNNVAISIKAACINSKSNKEDSVI